MIQREIENIINNDLITYKLTPKLSNILLNITKRFMSEYYDKEIKIIDNNIYFYKKYAKKPVVFSWYQVTINILPNVIVEKLEHNFEIDRLDKYKFMTFGNQLSIKLIEGRVDYIHDRGDHHHPIIVLRDYINKLDKYNMINS